MTYRERRGRLSEDGGNMEREGKIKKGDVVMKEGRLMARRIVRCAREKSKEATWEES